MPGRLRTASNPSRIVMDWAPYSAFAFFFWAATVEQISSGVACERFRLPRALFVQSTGNHCQHRFSDRVSTHLIKLCTEFLEHRCVMTLAKVVCAVQAALSRTCPAGLGQRPGVAPSATTGRPARSLSTT